MTDPDDVVAIAFQRMRDEMTFRRMLLLTHVFFGVSVGLAIFLTGAPTPVEIWFGPWPRYAMGGLGIIGGLLILLGLIKSDTTESGWRCTLAGVVMLFVWHIITMAIYIAAASIAGTDVLAFNEPADPMNYGRTYIPFVYLTLSLLLVSQIVMLFKVRPHWPLVP